MPESLRLLKNLEFLGLEECPGLGIPPEVLAVPEYSSDPEVEISASPSSILDYYFRIQRGGRRPLNEVRLIVVGRGGVGRTSLLKRLFKNTFNEHELETPGIEIDVHSLRIPNSEDVRLHVWDFGGQEILHATHHFFLTQRTVYLLVLSGREGSSPGDAEYWLQLINSFGRNSSVIVALNKSQMHPFDVNRGILLEKYPFIRDFLKTSLWL